MRYRHRAGNGYSVMEAIDEIVVPAPRLCQTQLEDLPRIDITTDPVRKRQELLLPLGGVSLVEIEDLERQTHSLLFGIQKYELFEAFFAAVKSKPEGTPALMYNDCNNTDGVKEFVFRVWDTDDEAPEVNTWILSPDEAADVITNHLHVNGVPTMPGNVEIKGFDHDGSGYMMNSGLSMSIWAA